MAKLSNTATRILAAGVMLAGLVLVAVGQHWGWPTVRWLTLAIGMAMMVEMVVALRRAPRDNVRRNAWLYGAFLVWLVVVTVTGALVAARPWIILLMLMIIVAADTGAWLFGKIIGGDKMWERLSAGKTWSGQIAGILCGTFASVMYGLLGTDTFMPQLMWIGISVALLSQYGDLTASLIKRRLGIKDFSNVIPGHGGILDRFDGWIYVLPVVWFVLI
ncbi:CDP-archaeol synthase [bacterium]|nr:CDP-archaeol synthase [bacterium]